MIVDVDNENGIGYRNKLLCHISEDLKYFKKMTHGKAIVMGLNTFLSLPKAPLPNRINIVLTTKTAGFADPNIIVMHSIESVIKWAEANPEIEVMICGGASVYEQFMEYASKLYVTHIAHTFQADTFFPGFDDWEPVWVQADRENLKHQYPHIFTIYEKIQE